MIVSFFNPLGTILFSQRVDTVSSVLIRLISFLCYIRRVKKFSYVRFPLEILLVLRCSNSILGSTVRSLS